MNKAVRGFFLPCLFLFFAGCTDNQNEPEKKAEVSGVFSTKSDDSLSIFVSELRRSDLGAGYRIEYSRDHGYRGEYLEFSHDGHVVIDAMKIPMEKSGVRDLDLRYVSAPSRACRYHLQVAWLCIWPCYFGRPGRPSIRLPQQPTLVMIQKQTAAFRRPLRFALEFGAG
jgi:hypothetical protein